MQGTLKKYVKERLRRFILATVQDDLKRVEARTVVIADQLSAFRGSAARERQNYYEGSRYDPVTLRNRLLAADVPVEDARVDVADFDKWLEAFPEINARYRGSDVHVEKCLEHYLAHRWLCLERNEVYIDIAAAGSNWADVLNARGIAAYKLDLSYHSGINGRMIGADAADTHLPTGFAGAMSLQCAFETFQGDADMRFIKEAQRVLNHRGRLAIVPLYLDNAFTNLSSPYVDLSRVALDPGAIRVWREDVYREPFSRHYSPESFAERIYKQTGPMKSRVLFFVNLDEVRALYPGQRVCCNFMLFCNK